jgi:hypothetical protein
VSDDYIIEAEAWICGDHAWWLCDGISLGLLGTLLGWFAEKAIERNVTEVEIMYHAYVEKK